MSPVTGITVVFPSISGKPPKEKGCFQCSRRRIVCDRGEPTCEKCIKKGISCSGLGRIRFADGVARKGKLKGCKMPDQRGDEEALAALTANISYSQVRWDNEQKIGRLQKRALKQPKKKKSAPQDETVSQPDNSPPRALTSQITAAIGAEKARKEERLMRMIRSTQSAIKPWLPPLASDVRMLFSYCQSLRNFEEATCLQKLQSLMPSLLRWFLSRIYPTGITT